MATPPVFSAGAVLTAAQMNAVSLWLVKKQTISAGATIIVDDCFNADFTNYRIVANINSSTDLEFRAQMRVSGSANTTTNYSWQRLLVDGTGTVAQRSTAVSYGIIGFGNADTTGFSADVFSPYASERTRWICTNLTQTSTVRIEFLNMIFGLTTSFTGFEIDASTGQFDSGTICVYGYRE